MTGYGARAFDGSNAESVCNEAAAWLKVMDDLKRNLDELQGDRRTDAGKAILEAETALGSCLSEGIVLTDPLVENARRAVMSVLAYFRRYEDVVDCAFFIAVVAGSLNSAIDEAKTIDPSKVPRGELHRFKRSLESVLEAFEDKLAELEEDLDSQESDADVRDK